MDKQLETKLMNVLKAEFDYVKRAEKDKQEKNKKMFDIYHIQQVINNFDELEPVISKYLNEKAEKERFER